MKPLEIIEALKQKIEMADQLDWDYNRKEERVKITHREWHQGLTLGISEISAKITARGVEALDEVVYIINETFRSMARERAEGFNGEEAVVLPVIRSTSFPEKSKEGHRFITEYHTAETRIYYALDLGSTYRLIDEHVLAQLGMSEEQLKERALFKAQALPIELKEDEVDGNIFYFLNMNDGYDATRILNRAFLKEMSEKVEGHMTVSVPHQDVLIIGDLRNNVGYDVLAQMTMHFFTVGTVPITSLSFIYDEGKLDPIFILAKNQRIEGEDN